MKMTTVVVYITPAWASCCGQADPFYSGIIYDRSDQRLHFLQLGQRYQLSASLFDPSRPKTLIQYVYSCLESILSLCWRSAARPLRYTFPQSGCCVLNT